MTQVRLSTGSHHLAGVVFAILALVLCAPVAQAQTISFTPVPGGPAGAGGSPFSVAVGDFNNDGRADYAVANARDNTVSVFLGNGDGTFSPAPRSPFIVN